MFVAIESIVREPILSESEREPIFMAHEIPRIIEGDRHSDLSCFFVDFSCSDQGTNRFYIAGMLEFSRTRAPEVSPSPFPASANFYSATEQQIIRFWITCTKYSKTSI
jgi:hypothetical protein